MNQAWAQARSSWPAFLVALSLLGSTSIAAAQTNDEPLPELPALPETQDFDEPGESTEPQPPQHWLEPAPPPATDGAHAPDDVFEPPPPPPPHPHLAPRSSFVLGGRFGYLVPFGKLTHAHPDGYGGPDWREIAGPGPSFEVNVGGRIERHFLVYGIWEFGALGTGRDRGFGEQHAAHTHLFGAGVRFSTHPDETGLAVEAALGFRTFRADFDGDVAITTASPEVRIGIGADIRISRDVTLSPMVQLSNGSFLDLRLHEPGRPSRSIFGYEALHGTFGFALGAHFDLFRSAR